MEHLKISGNGQWDLLTKSKAMNNRKGNLGITPEKGRIKFDPDFSQDEFQEYVEQRADHMSKTGYVKGEPDDFKWHYEKDFDTNKLLPLKKDREGWVSWYNGEMYEWQYDHGDERKGHFEEWVKDPYSKPLIVIEGTDGKIHQIDGHHRAAMAFIKNLKTVPVVYGTRKK